MIIECIALLPTLPQAVRLGKFFRAGEQEFPVKVGQAYAVYGVRVWGGGVWVDIEGPANYLVVVPLCLFTIIDGSVPRVWEVRVDEAGDVAILPEAFHNRYFIDDLSEGKPEAWKAFMAVKERIGGAS